MPKRVWVDDWEITYKDRRQLLTGVDRYRGLRIDADLAYSEVFERRSDRRMFYQWKGKDGRWYVLGKPKGMK